MAKQELTKRYYQCVECGHIYDCNDFCPKCEGRYGVITIDIIKEMIEHYEDNLKYLNDIINK